MTDSWVWLSFLFKAKSPHSARMIRWVFLPEANRFASSIILIRITTFEIGNCMDDLLLSGSTAYVSIRFANDAFSGSRLK
jgi:hypothetical protein